MFSNGVLIFAASMLLLGLAPSSVRAQEDSTDVFFMCRRGKNVRWLRAYKLDNNKKDHDTFWCCLTNGCNRCSRSSVAARSCDGRAAGTAWHSARKLAATQPHRPAASIASPACAAARKPPQKALPQPARAAVSPAEMPCWQLCDTTRFVNRWHPNCFTQASFWELQARL